MTLFFCAFCAAGGFALCWFIKDTLVLEFSTTEAFIAKLEAKVKALKAVL